MATTIQIKRSPNVTAATTTDLQEGELAYSYDKSNNGDGAKLYIEVQDSGGGAVIHTIGGKYYTTKVDAATSAATASTLVQRDAFGSLAANNISLSGNIALGGTKITGGGTGFFVDPILNNTSGNVVYYNPVTKEVTYGTVGNASTATQLATARDIGLAGDLTGNVSFDGSQNVTLTATITANSVALGTDTTGNYIANVIPGTGLTGSGFGTEGATPTVSLANTAVTLGTYGGATNIPAITIDAQGRITSASNTAISTSFTVAGDSGTNQTIAGGDTLTIAGGTGLTSVGSNTDTVTLNLDNTAVTPSTYGGAASTAVFTVDQQGRLTAASNVSISIPSSAINTDIALGSQTSGAYVANLVAGTGITLSGLGNEGTTPTITNSGVTSVTGTANQIAVSGSTGAVTLSLPNDVIINNNLTVTGDLLISGNAVTMNTATVLIEDSLIKLGNANPSDSLDLGFFGQYVSAGTKYAGLFRDASDSGKFKLFVDLTVDPTSNVVDTSSYTVATLVSNLTGGTVTGLTSNITVGNGGTGVGTFTTNGILYGNATGSLKVTSAGTDGQVLQVNASGVPIFAGLDGGTY